jgi:hypothetical protein
MIPEIGLMIGCYVVFRCVEAFCAAPNRYGGENQRIVIGSLGTVTILVAIGVMIALLKSGAAIQNVPDLKFP